MSTVGDTNDDTLEARGRIPNEDIVRRFPIGTKLRIFPNHACATGAQFPEYHAIDATGDVATWERFYGW